MLIKHPPLNRGEIATRILAAASELDIHTTALVTTNDTSHALSASQSLNVPSPASYLDIPYLISLVRTHNIDAVHPGYGFLSESADFSRRMWEEAGVLVVGPGWDVLAQTGDKLAARRLALECDVPVLPAMDTPTRDIETITKFADQVGYPIMLKAVDGGYVPRRTITPFQPLTRPLSQRWPRHPLSTRSLLPPLPRRAFPR